MGKGRGRAGARPGARAQKGMGGEKEERGKGKGEGKKERGGGREGGKKRRGGRKKEREKKRSRQGAPKGDRIEKG